MMSVSTVVLSGLLSLLSLKIILYHTLSLFKILQPGEASKVGSLRKELADLAYLFCLACQGGRLSG